MGSSRHVDNGGGFMGKELFVFGKVLHTKGRAHNDEFERNQAVCGSLVLLGCLLAQRNGDTEHPQQNIRVEVSFVCLIEDNDGILAQQQILLNLLQQNAVRHELDPRVAAQTRRFVSGLVGHQIAPRRPPNPLAVAPSHFVADTLGGRNGSHPTRLGHPHHIVVVVAPVAAQRKASLVQELWHLGALSRTRLGANDGHIVVANGIDNLELHRTNRKVVSLLFNLFGTVNRQDSSSGLAVVFVRVQANRCGSL